MKKSIFIILVIIFSMLATNLSVYAQSEENNVKAKVIENNGTKEVEQENTPTQIMQNVKIRILEGEYENEEYELVYEISQDLNNCISNVELKEKDNILVRIDEIDGEIVSINYI